jgi:hypothetical protein
MQELKFVNTFDTNHSVAESTQTIKGWFSSEASWFCSQVNQQRLPQSQFIRRNDHVIDQFEISR